MLQDVAADDKIDAGVGDTVERFKIANQIGFSDGRNVRVDGAQRIPVRAVHVTDPSAARHPKRRVERADLDPVAAQIFARKLDADARASQQPSHRGRQQTLHDGLPQQAPHKRRAIKKFIAEILNHANEIVGATGVSSQWASSFPFP